MKTKFLIIVILSMHLFLINACTKPSKPKRTIVIKESDIVTKNIHVSGMTCVGCEVTLENSISDIEGVVSVKASHKKNEAKVQYDSTKTNLTAIKQEIKKLGYKTVTNK